MPTLKIKTVFSKYRKDHNSKGLQEMNLHFCDTGGEMEMVSREPLTCMHPFVAERLKNLTVMILVQ